MKKIHKLFCLPFIAICIFSILFIYYLSCIPDVLELQGLSIIFIFLACIIIIVGIFTDSTYIIREKLSERNAKINRKN